MLCHKVSIFVKLGLYVKYLMVHMCWSGFTVA